jgi:hypothetical protein
MGEGDLFRAFIRHIRRKIARQPEGEETTIAARALAGMIFLVVEPRSRTSAQDS